MAMVRTYPRKSEPNKAIEGLSRRQLEVLELLAKGLTNEELAGVLGISPATVRTHVTAILARLDVTNRTEAATMYVTWSARPPESSGQQRRPAIVVLPIVVSEEDPRARAVAGAIGGDISDLFARWCWFPVIAHDWAVGVGPDGLGLSALGQQLGAAFLVVGSLRRASACWRLSVRIDSAADGHCIWTAHHDLPDHALFAVQDAVCEALVAAAYPVLIACTQAGLRRAPDPHEREAWELAHDGMQLIAAGEGAANAAAQSLFRVALERQPDLLLAHFGLGLASHDEVQNQWGPREDACARLRICAERCVSLAPHGAEGHYLLGRYFQTRGEHTLATRSLESAIRHNPSFTAAHLLLAQVLLLSGRSEEALTRMRHAQQISPDSCGGLASFHSSRREYEEALVVIERAFVAPSDSISLLQ